MGRLARKLQTLMSLPPQPLTRHLSFSRLPKLNLPSSTHPRKFESASFSAGTVPKGYLPIRVVNACTSHNLLYYVKAEHLSHPLIMDLLQRTADEYGYSHAGVLQVICDYETFEDILLILNTKR